jgi:hypothetical protein
MKRLLLLPQIFCRSQDNKVTILTNQKQQTYLCVFFKSQNNYVGIISMKNKDEQHLCYHYY